MKKNQTWLNHLLNLLSVILGVYLAFYINDRAKSAAEKKEGLLLMQSMVNDIAADIKTYSEYQIPANNQQLEGIDSLLVLLSNNDKEKISIQLPTIFQVENYTPSSSTYNSIKSSGKIKLIDDLALQKKLSDYYDGLAVECMKKNELQANYFINELVSWLTVNADLMEMKLFKEGEWTVLSNKLLIYQSFINQKVNNYEMIVEESTALKVQLDSLIHVK
ncbi:MAG: hypothetical protein AAFZ15_02470 [Bacteroidota bacterium]